MFPCVFRYPAYFCPAWDITFRFAKNSYIKFSHNVADITWTFDLWGAPYSSWSSNNKWHRTCQEKSFKIYLPLSSKSFDIKAAVLTNSSLETFCFSGYLYTLKTYINYMSSYLSKWESTFDTACDPYEKDCCQRDKYVELYSEPS